MSGLTDDGPVSEAPERALITPTADFLVLLCLVLVAATTLVVVL